MQTNHHYFYSIQHQTTQQTVSGMCTFKHVVSHADQLARLTAQAVADAVEAGVIEAEHLDLPLADWQVSMLSLTGVEIMEDVEQLLLPLLPSEGDLTDEHN